MPFQVLLQFGLLILAMVIAFAISFVVGMLLVSIAAAPLSLRGGPDVSRPRPPPGPVPQASVERPSSESLAPVIDSVI